MANYSSLKSSITSAIKTNGNREITGAVLQSALLAIINSLGDGFIYKGIATNSTNPGTPDQNVFYVGGPGTYSNFGTPSKTVNDGYLGFFKYNGSWSFETVQVGDANAVKYIVQALTNEQKEQARVNIGAGTYSKPDTGIPSTDMDVDVQTSLGKADSAYQKPGTGIPANDLARGVIPTVPDISTDILADAASNTKTTSPKAVKTYVDAHGGNSAVKYTPQTLTNNQKRQARRNIDGVSTTELSQLEHKVDDFATGKYYGTFTSSSLLPEGTISGFAYIGSDNPFEVWVFNGTSWANSGATMDGVPAPSTNPFKGLYNSLGLLEMAYPYPQIGDYAYVKNGGTPATANIYNAVNGQWSDTNIVVSVTDMESVFPLFAKLSLISTLEKVAWIDANGQNYLNDLRTALLGNIELMSISVSFNPGTKVILDTMSLDDLKDYLTVTATFSDGTQESVSGYQLSGTLAVGTNTITVTYFDETDTFTVTVKHNYAGSLDTWAVRPGTGATAEYVNGYIRMKCNTTTIQEGWGCWCADAAKSTWGAVNGKRLRVRVKVNTISSSVGTFGLGAYSTTSPTSLGNAVARRASAGTWVLADDGFYEYEKVIDISDFTYGTYSVTNNSAFGIYCYARALNEYIEIYDAQIFEVE